ncbi:hypothetical protein ACFW2Y_11020 [Streptomyces sp. NPDC058877]|uniref:hypothetical protein n=1 Tax=Streptomyces sp. NPDC058877 TaxID=3346665 RepID=UPI0036A89C58
MNRRDSSRAVGGTDWGEGDRLADAESLGESGWLDEEILKVLMGADVEVDPEGVG